jgi:hypothetical protein
MRRREDYLELALQYAREAAKAQDSCSRYQLLTLAESYQALAQSTGLLERSAKAVEAVDNRRKEQGRA